MEWVDTADFSVSDSRSQVINLKDEQTSHRMNRYRVPTLPFPSKLAIMPILASEVLLHENKKFQ